MMSKRYLTTLLLIGGSLALLGVNSSATFGSSPSLIGGDGEVGCATFPAAGERLDNRAFVTIGEPLVGVTQSADVVASLSSIYCFEAEPTASLCNFTCGDLNGDAELSLLDFGIFQMCFDASPQGDCVCADLNGDKFIDLTDFALFTASHTKETMNLVPNCP